MRRLTKTAASAASVLAIAALAGLGASSGSSAAGYSIASGQSGSAATAASAARIAVGKSSLGRILVTGQGRSVYLFEKDHRKASTCYGACASAWPPVTTSRAPIATKGVVVALLGTRKRREGTLQVTYNGHPLYEYAGDTKAGQTNGQGSNAYGGAWYVLSPGGTKIDND
jgi:predicted lipoprotein with Yx(FWY)xxD motif